MPRTPPHRQGAVSSYDFLKKKYQIAQQNQKLNGVEGSGVQEIFNNNNQGLQISNSKKLP